MRVGVHVKLPNNKNWVFIYDTPPSYDNVMYISDMWLTVRHNSVWVTNQLDATFV